VVPIPHSSGDGGDSSSGGGSRGKPPNQVSLTNPQATWVARPGVDPFFTYDANYLIDNNAGIIVDAEGSRLLRRGAPGPASAPRLLAKRGCRSAARTFPKSAPGHLPACPRPVTGILLREFSHYITACVQLGDSQISI
jgi:hypothetical protein